MNESVTLTTLKCDLCDNSITGENAAIFTEEKRVTPEINLFLCSAECAAKTVDLIKAQKTCPVCNRNLPTPSFLMAIDKGIVYCGRLCYYNRSQSDEI